MTGQAGKLKDFSPIEISAHGDRRELEAWYLEMKQLAKQHGLEIEFTLSKEKPDSTAD